MRTAGALIALERTIHVHLSGWRRYFLFTGLDLLCVCCAFYIAYAVRFEGHIPAASLAQFREYLPLLLAIRLPLHFLFGIHRWSFRFSGFHEAIRLVLSSVTGTAVFVACFYFMQRAHEDVSIGPPRAVLLIELFLTMTLMGAFRFSPRLAHAWLIDTMRAPAGDRVRALIVGAGSAGDLLLRDLDRSDEHRYEIVGFVDDDASKWGTSLGGRPVLGPLSSLREVAVRRAVRELLFAIPRVSAPRVREILSSCADLKLKYKSLPVSFAYLNDRAKATRLLDLAPEDLLPRHQTQFDEAGLAARLMGRRVLVTGAGGSIGSEISRQVARLRPGMLLLSDINENELYLLYRRLGQEYPDVDVRVEVADIRDRRRLDQLGGVYSPQVVFHAAAHKHVPLMEHSPEEAVKNNVTGCLNVVDMAAGVAERFVLISTDKAVNPSSVMGATKRIAEMIVADRAARGHRGFTAVRFGNVLGSAGSVVPLFKAQITSGGPVTVTHPECRRYLMTIPEAVGLVLAAGLGDYGDLCILQMGEPILILDLARLMITMAGLVPDDEIKIVFTGLRPGERLDEQLMTEDEERNSRTVGDTICVVRNIPPPQGLLERIVELEAMAAVADRQGLIRAIGTLVPSFCSPALEAAALRGQTSH